MCSVWGVIETGEKPRLGLKHKAMRAKPENSCEKRHVMTLSIIKGILQSVEEKQELFSILKWGLS